MTNKLQIVATENDSNLKKPLSNHKTRKIESQAIFERLWLTSPEQFDPLKNAMQRERLSRTLKLLAEFIDVQNKMIADLGCGSGVMTQKLQENGAFIHAVDIASNALKLVNERKLPNVQTLQDYVPQTMLKDSFYDVTISLELIALLPAIEHRLFFAELRRLIKTNGFAICSTSIDINSDDALQKFETLAETELKIEKSVHSYHRLYIHVKDFFEAPRRFVQANNDQNYRTSELNKRFSLNKWWFKINSCPIPTFLWSAVKYLSNPIANSIDQSSSLLHILESICKFLWSDSGISHVIIVGTSRPLTQIPSEKNLPIERKHKKEVWE